MAHRSFLHCLTAWLVLAIAAVSSPAYAVEEYTLKATYIVNFTKYVEWPDGRAISKQSKINVCLFGDSDLVNAEQIFKTASTEKLAISLVKEKSLSNVPVRCHMLFISASEAGKLDDILSSLKNQPVLTISDIDGFAEHGGMMGFVVKDDTIKIVMNKIAAENAGFHIDSLLLELALRVIDK